MTKSESGRCVVCRVRLDRVSGPGRPRQFCTPACRQRHWVAQQASSDLERSESELRQLRDDLDAVLDDVAELLDALEAQWETPADDEIQNRLGEITRSAAAALRRRLRR